MRVNRFPVAANTALAIAGAVIVIADSPAPAEAISPVD
jgi:hypothetical protein